MAVYLKKKMYIYTQKGNNTKNNEIMKRVRNLTLCIGIITVFLCACSGGGQRTISGLNPADFDTIINNKAVKLFTLSNESGGSLYHQLWWKTRFIVCTQQSWTIDRCCLGF